MSAQTVFDRLAGPQSLNRMLYDAATAARQKARGAGVDKQNAFTQSWLFTGPPGSGRSVAAKAFAAALVCSNPEVVGCGRCEDCRLALVDAHGDIVHIIPHELTISVDRMREVIGSAATQPTVANWRVIIIEDADRLSDGAANALLKTVEEPAERTIIILCSPSTDPHDIAITLRSRCRHVYVPTPSAESVTRILMAEGGISEDAARLAAASSGGHIGRARHLAHNQAAQIRRANILNLAELIYHGDQAFRTVNTLVKGIEAESRDALAEVEKAESDKLMVSLGMGTRGKGAQKLLRGTTGQLKDLEKTQERRRTRFLRDALDLSLVDLAGIYRDALLISSGAGISLTHPDFEGLSRELAERVGNEGLVACLDAISVCRESFGFNVRPIVAMDALVGRLRKAYRVS
ncbi:DNA polymerase III subunit delta' [Corynebacterium pacaense]|uniref:DNA polymerase III subunit delta' n=1 Tax=Corynebacterium pacaense TaxID=1816684 RepID=UPI0009BA4A26|nr:DNA polymerase III subunit delta' [Corynebacterium pacaense]